MTDGLGNIPIEMYGIEIRLVKRLGDQTAQWRERVNRMVFGMNSGLSR